MRENGFICVSIDYIIYLSIPNTSNQLPESLYHQAGNPWLQRTPGSGRLQRGPAGEEVQVLRE